MEPENLTLSPLLWGDIAPVWRRVFARVVDLLVVFFVQFVLVVVQIFWFMNSLSERFDPEPWGRPFVASLTYISLYCIYEIFFHTKANGQTPGKLLLHVKVVRVVDGNPPRWWQSLLRWPLAGVAFPLLFVVNFWLALGLWLAPGITAVATRKRRALHDHISSTMVVSHEPTEEERRQDQEIRERARERREKYSIWKLWGDRGGTSN